MQSGNSSRLKSFLKNPWIRLIIAVDVVAIIVIVGILIYNATKTCTLNFSITPLDATISVNGNNSYENGSYQIHPGKYEITISKDGFAPKSFSIELESGYSASITTFLSGENGELDFYELKENYASLEQLISMASSNNNLTTDQDTSAGNFIATFNKNYALFDKLPIMQQTPTGYGLEIGVNYQYNTLLIENGINNDDCSKTLCLYVTDTIGNREAYARSIVKKFGFDPSAFEIIYKKVEHE